MVLALYADFNPEQQKITEAVTRLVSISISSGLDHAAFVSAQRAARCALLMMASRPIPLKVEQIETLRDVARLPLRDGGHSPATRLALARRIVTILEGVLRQYSKPESSTGPGGVVMGSVLPPVRPRSRHTRR
jgi:hypothetical protein